MNNEGTYPDKSAEKTYFAFISYKREDEKWAKWLKKKLVSYRLPTKLCKQYQDLPKKFSNIFLDKEDMLPGKMGSNLESDLKDTKYLIVICSENAHDKPFYIEKEIKTFLDVGHTYEQVIPFIIGDSKQPEKDCFPPLLSEINETNELIGVNIHDRGAGRAYLKTVAYMLGLKPAEIESADDLRRRKQTALFAAASLLFICLFSYGSNYWWQHIAEHTNYYQSFVYDGNVTQGVNQISKSELDEYSRYYRIKTVDKRVKSVEYLNYAGILIQIDDDATVLNLNASKIIYTYSGNDERSLQTAQYYDHNERPLVCYQFSSDGTHVTLLQNESSGISGYAVADITDTSVFSDRVNVTRYIQEFDDNGRICRRFFAYGEKYASMSDGSGIFGYDLSYDTYGNLTSVTYFRTADGTVKGNLKGADSVTYTYSEENSRLFSTIYSEVDGEAVADDDGWTVKEIEWAGNNAISKISYFDSNHEAVLTADGYASVEKYYNGLDIEKKAYFDCDGNSAATVYGYASETYVTDKKGEIVSRRYWDINGDAAVDTSSGVYGYDITNISDKEYYFTYIDDNGEPMLTDSGYAYKYVVVDDLNYPLKNEYRDEAGELCTGHYAYCTFEYEPIYHKVLECRYFDENGNPTIGESDCASVIFEYDSRGVETLLEYFDENGNLYEGKRDYAKIVRSFEVEGTYTTETHMYYDANDEPVIHQELGSVGCEYTTNEYGKMVGFYYLDENGYPFFDQDSGYAGVGYLYDEFGYIKVVAYYGEALQPIMVDGAATIYINHDEYGNVLSYKFYNDKGEMAVNPNEGYAMSLNSYNEYGKLSGTSYFDGQGNYMKNSNAGYAMSLYSYNEYGRLSGICYFDELGNCMINPNEGYAMSLYSSNEYGKPSGISYFDESGNYLINPNEGYAMSMYSYNDFGELSGIYYYDEQGNFINNPNAGYAVMQAEFDENGNIIGIIFAKVENGELVIIKN